MADTLAVVGIDEDSLTPVVPGGLAKLDDEASRLTILTPDDERDGHALLALADRLIKEVKQGYATPKAKAWDTHRAIVAAEKQYLELPLRAREVLREKLGEYRVQADAEERRLQAEAEAKSKQSEEERKLSEAAALEELGLDAEAESVLAERAIPAPIVGIHKPAPEGLSYRENWEFQITDATLLPAKYLSPDQKKIGAVVRAFKAQTEIPGVRVYARKVPINRHG